MGKILFLSLVFCLLAAQAFPSWQQQLKVVATDLNGMPAGDVAVDITYQKEEPGSATDGSEVGSTAADGNFFANLTNSVPSGLDRRTIEVKVSAFYWNGASKTVLPDFPGVKEVSFQLPIALEQLNIVVTDSKGNVVPGAQVSLAGENGKATGEDGAAVYFVPQEAHFEGVAQFGGQSAGFSESQAAIVGGRKTIEVRLALAAKNETGMNETPPEKNETLTGLLKINSIEAIVEGSNCYLIRASVSDPRTELPLDVKFVLLSNNASLPTGVDEQGLFFARACVISDTVVKVVASNKYDAAEGNATLAFAQPRLPPSINYTPGRWGKEEKPEPPSPLILAAIASAAIVALVGGAAYFLTRKSVGRKISVGAASTVPAVSSKIFEMAVRPVIIYVRKMFYLFSRKKRKPPQVRPPAAS